MRPFILFSILAVATPLFAAEENRKQNTVILDETAVQNLQLEFAEAEETDFEETLFSLGHIEVLPGNRAIVSSRIPGRVFSLLAAPDREVEAGAEVAWIESRQPGDPPPTVKLEAPISGMISKVNIAQGQPVSPDDELIEILDLSTVEAEAEVPQHVAGSLKPGAKAHIRVNALPGKVFETQLAHLATLADEDSSTLSAAFHVANPDLLLRPGMRAEFSIVVSRREDVMSIPHVAVQGDTTNRFVYIKDYELDNAFVKVPVVVGARNNDRIEIIQGLFPGDEVVTRGAYALAFAGSGSVSLKEALDAAHGHPHNEDGTEVTEEQRAAEVAHSDPHHHGEASLWNQLSIFLAVTCGVLLTLLILSQVRKPQAIAD